jgi:hypothetical protein
MVPVQGSDPTNSANGDSLPSDRGCRRVPRPRKRDKKGIPLRIDLAPMMLGEDSAQKSLLIREQIRIALSQSRQQTRRPLNVREQKGDGAAWKLSHNHLDYCAENASREEPSARPARHAASPTPN